MLLYNNTLFAFNSDCSKIIYAAGQIKYYAEKSLDSDFLSTCKYYVLNSSQLYEQITEANLNCNCINIQDNELNNFFDKAEISNTIKDCKKYVKKSLNQLNLMVDNIINCKKTKN